MKLDKSEEIRRTRWAQLSLLLVVGSGLLFIYVGLPAWMHHRKTLQRDYEEIFATPFKDVQVSEYWNANTGHGVRFRIFLMSTSPLQLKNPEAFKEVPFDSRHTTYNTVPAWFAKHHAPWIAQCLYRKQPVLGQAPGPVWIYLSQSKNECEIEARTPDGKEATKRNGDILTVSKASGIEFDQVDESYIASSKKLDHSRIVIENSDLHVSAVSTRSVDPRIESYKSPTAFYNALSGYLRELELYNGKEQGSDHFFKHKLLNIEIPDGTVSDEQVAILEKLGKDVKDYNSHIQRGMVPVRLRITVLITGTDARFMTKHQK